MNNYETAVDATETAITSQGSAMRENAQYMKSFEAKINKLKTGFTQFAQSVGDAILSDGLMLLISNLTSLASASAKVIDTIGFLPPLLLAVTAVAGKMGVFNKLTKSISNAGFALSNFRANSSKSVGVVAKEVKGVEGAFNGVTRAENKASIGAKTFGISLKSALVTSGIGIAVVGLGILIEKLISKWQDAKVKQEEIKKLNEKMVDTYRKSTDGMQSMLETYDTLSKKTSLTADEQSRLNEITATFANGIPTTVEYIDASGEAHMKSTEKIKEQILYVRDLSKAQAELTQAKFLKDMQKQAKSYTDVAKEIKKLREEEKKLREEDGEEVTTQTTFGGGKKGAKITRTTDNTQKIAKSQVDQLLQQAELTKAVQTTTKSIQGQTLAYFEASNQASKLGDSQMSVLEDVISANENVIRSAGTSEEAFNKAYASLYTVGVEIGTVFTDAYDILSEGFGDDPLQLKEMKSELSDVSDLIPEDFFSLDNRSLEESKVALKEIVNVGHQVESGNENWKTLSGRLEEVGLTSDEAGKMIYLLGLDYNNTGVLAGDLKKDNDLLNESLEKTKEISEMDLVTELFGYSKQEAGAIESALQAILIAEDRYGEAGARTKETWKKGSETITDFLNITEDNLIQNKDRIFDFVGALEKIDLSQVGKLDKDGIKIDFEYLLGDIKGVSDKTKDLIKKWYKSDDKKNFFTNESEKANESIDKTKGKTKKTGEVFDIVNKKAEILYGTTHPTAEKPSMFDQIVTDSDRASLGMKGAQKKADFLKEHTGLTLYPTFLDGLGTDSDTAGRKIDKTNKKVGYFRDDLLIPSPNNLLLGVNSDLDKTDSKINGAKETLGLLKYDLITPIAQPALVGSVTGGMTEIDKSLGTTYDKFTTVTGQILNGTMLEGSNAVVNGAIRDMNTLLDTAMGKAQSLNEKLKKVVSSIDNITSINSSLDKIKGKISDVLKRLDVLKTKMSNLIDGVAFANAYKAIAKIGDTATDSKKKFQKLLSTINGANVIKSMGQYLIVKSTVLKVGTASDVASSKVSGFKRAVRGLFNIDVSASSNILSVLNNIINSLIRVSSYSNNVVNAQKKVINSISSVMIKINIYNDVISGMGTHTQKVFNRMANNVKNCIKIMIQQYDKNKTQIGLMAKDADKSLNKMTSSFISSSAISVLAIETMANGMRREFKSSMDNIVDIAGSVPVRIGKAIRENISSSSSSMGAVATDMVKRFKSELGIHSPSRVFTNLGGWVIKGLANGLTGGNLKSLGTSVFDDFGGGVFNSMDMIKAFLSADMGSMGGVASGNVKNWLMSAIGITGVDPSWLPMLQTMAMKESGGNPRAINLWDSNAKAGIPSKGLMQTIEPTFDAYKMSGLNNIYNPIHNAVASIRYVLARYGSIFNTPGARSMAHGGGWQGYANGGFVDDKELAWHGEEGSEAIIPLISKRRKRGLDLWEETGSRLGINPSAIEFLKNISRKRGASNSTISGESSFGASDGEGVGGESIGGGSDGTSGTIQSSEPMDNSFVFSALDDRADLFEFNKYERQADGFENTVGAMEAKMSGLTKSALKYRKVLQKIIAYEKAHLKVIKKDLKTTEKRNRWVEKRLSQLSNTRGHSKKQREEYNKLQQEYESNISKIGSFKAKVESMAIDIRNSSAEVFADFINEIVKNYDSAIDKIKSKIDDIDFKIDVMGLTNPSDKKGMLNLQADKATESQKAQSNAKNKYYALKKEYSYSIKKYGRNSEQAKNTLEEKDKSAEAWEDATLAVLNAEKEIKDTRAKVADDGISQLKDYYGSMKDMAVKAIDAEQEALKKAHDKKIEMYDEEISKINSVYDEKLKSMDEEKSKEDYQETLTEKNLEKTELVNKISLLSRDNSLEGKKKLAELQKELTDLNKDISDFQEDRQDELLRKAMAEQKDQQVEAIESKKTTEDEALNSSVEKLDVEKDSVTKKYDDILNDDKRWADMRNQFITGSFSKLDSELGKMKTSLNEMNNGIFTGLTAGFATFSAEVQNQVAELNKLIVGNMVFDSNPIVDDVNEVARAKDYKITDGKSGIKVGRIEAPDKSKTASVPKPAPAPKPEPKPKPKNRYHTVRDGDTLWDLADRYYGNPTRWGKIYNANKRPDPRKLQIGRKLLVPFKDGGYTGDDVPKSGAIALVHKKEQILTEKQTESYFDTVKLLGKLALPKFKTKMGEKLATANAVNINNNYGDVSIVIEDGLKKRSKDIVGEVLTGLNKRGK